jgi:hypothetical protein
MVVHINCFDAVLASSVSIAKKKMRAFALTLTLFVDPPGFEPALYLTYNQLYVLDYLMTISNLYLVLLYLNQFYSFQSGLYLPVS